MERKLERDAGSENNYENFSGNAREAYSNERLDPLQPAPEGS